MKFTASTRWLDDRDHRIQQLSAEIERLRMAQATGAAQLDAARAVFERLRDDRAVRVRDAEAARQRAAELERSLQASARELHARSSDLNQRTRELDARSRELDVCARELDVCKQALNARSRELDACQRELAVYSRELVARTSELRSIVESRGFRMLSALYRLRLMIAPHGSWLERMLLGRPSSAAAVAAGGGGSGEVEVAAQAAVSQPAVEGDSAEHAAGAADAEVAAPPMASPTPTEAAPAPSEPIAPEPSSSATEIEPVAGAADEEEAAAPTASPPPTEAAPAPAEPVAPERSATATKIEPAAAPPAAEADFEWPEPPPQVVEASVKGDLERATALAEEQSGAADVGARYVPRCRRFAVVVLPIIDWDFRFQRPQQLASELALAGHPVFYVRLGFSRVPARRELHPGVIELSLTGPTGVDAYSDTLDPRDAEQLADQIALELRRDAIGSAVTLVQLPFWLPLATALRQKLDVPVVYDCMDEHAGFSTNSAPMLAQEQALASTADLVVASSEVLYDKLAGSARAISLVRNGADYEFFARTPEPDRPDANALRVGYYGAIADWFDSELMAAIAAARPQWQFTLVGSTHTADTAPLAGCPNITLAGEQPYVGLPAWLAQWDACIIPFKLNSLTAATNPVKVYEMLAAGKPVVAVPMPEVLPLADAGLLAVAATAEEFVQSIERAALEDSPERRDARRRFAAANTWRQRRELLVASMRPLFPLASIVVVTYNNLELNRLCIEGILADTDYPNIELIVVDNASSDGTVAYLQEVAAREARVRLVLNAENRGFAGGNNQGMAIARGHFVCLLNNDTVVTGSWLSSLLRHLQADPQIGLIGPVTNSISNEARIEVGYQYVTDMPRWADAHYSEHAGQHREVPMLAFFCVASRRAVWDEVGPLDEGFRIGMFEDDDWNRRARERGYRTELALDSFVHHWHNASLNRLASLDYRTVYFNNRRYYRRKWHEATLPDASQKAALDLLADSARGTRACVYFPRSTGAPDSVLQRRAALRSEFVALGLTVVAEAPARDPVAVRPVSSREFAYGGDPDWLSDVPGLFVWTDSSNFDARDHLSPLVPAVFDWAERFEAFAGAAERLEWLQWRGIDEAEVLLAATWSLRQTAAGRRSDVIFLPSVHVPAPALPGALDDPEWERLRSESAAPLAGYCGPLSSAVDYALLRDAAEARPDWLFVLVGPDVDGSLWHSRLQACFNVAWLDRHDPDRYAWQMDAVVLPVRDDDPLPSPNIIDLLAAGIPVIAPPLLQIESIDGVLRGASGAEFARCLGTARQINADPEQRARIRSAAQQTWRTRAEVVLAAVEKHLRQR